jgi:hypothetical protein
LLGEGSLKEEEEEEEEFSGIILVTSQNVREEKFNGIISVTYANNYVMMLHAWDFKSSLDQGLY